MSGNKLLEALKHLAQRPWSKRQENLQMLRSAYLRSSFVDEFGASPVSRKVAARTWDMLAAEAVVPDFRPMPDDDLLHVFGLADDDLDELVENLLTELEVRIPQPAEVEAMAPVRTVRDLIGFVVAIGERTSDLR